MELSSLVAFLSVSCQSTASLGRVLLRARNKVVRGAAQRVRTQRRCVPKTDNTSFKRSRFESPTTVEFHSSSLPGRLEQWFQIRLCCSNRNKNNTYQYTGPKSS